MWETPGSQRLHHQLSERGADTTRGKKIPKHILRKRTPARKAVGFRRHPKMVEKDWKPEEIALLGTMPDELLAEKLGRSINGVRVKRNRLGIPKACDRRRNN